MWTTTNPDLTVLKYNKITQSILQFDFKHVTHFNICDIRWHDDLLHATICTVFELTTQMQELDSSTIDDLWPNKTKVREVDKMKEKIASEFLLHYTSTMFTYKCFTCCRQSAVTDIAVWQIHKSASLREPANVSVKNQNHALINN